MDSAPSLGYHYPFPGTVKMGPQWRRYINYMAQRYPKPDASMEELRRFIKKIIDLKRYGSPWIDVELGLVFLKGDQLHSISSPDGLVSLICENLPPAECELAKRALLISAHVYEIKQAHDEMRRRTRRSRIRRVVFIFVGVLLVSAVSKALFYSLRK